MSLLKTTTSNPVLVDIISKQLKIIDEDLAALVVMAGLMNDFKRVHVAATLMSHVYSIRLNRKNDKLLDPPLSELELKERERNELILAEVYIDKSEKPN